MRERVHADMHALVRSFTYAAHWQHVQVGAELCGTLKNIVALGVGMVDGMGMGPNSKAAVIRQVSLTIADLWVFKSQVHMSGFYYMVGVRSGTVTVHPNPLLKPPLPGPPSPQGLLEMRDFCQALYPSVRDDTFLECCGVGDLVATCIGGRHRRVAEAWTRSAIESAVAGEGNGAGRSWAELEKELLQGQKLQGVLTSNEVQQILRVRETSVCV